MVKQHTFQHLKTIQHPILSLPLIPKNNDILNLLPSGARSTRSFSIFRRRSSSACRPALCRSTCRGPPVRLWGNPCMAPVASLPPWLPVPRPATRPVGKWCPCRPCKTAAQKTKMADFPAVCNVETPVHGHNPVDSCLKVITPKSNQERRDFFNVQLLSSLPSFSL